MPQGLEVFDASGKSMINSSYSLSRTAASVTIPRAFTGTVSGTFTDSIFEHGRIFFVLLNGTVPLNVWNRAQTPHGDRIQVSGVGLTVTRSGSTVSYSVTNTYGSAFPYDLILHIGVF